MNDKEYLEHVGILGMRWGHRKGSSGGSDTRRTKILKSPSKLKKHLDEFSKDEIDTAVKRMKLKRELRSISKDEMSAGSQYATSILAYGTVASSMIAFSNSPAGQTVAKAIGKAIGKVAAGGLNKEKWVY